MDYLVKFYELIAAGKESELMTLKLPVSDVFYARAAIKENLGLDVDIVELEQMMREEGLIS